MKRNKYYILLLTVLVLVVSFPVGAVNKNTFELNELDMNIDLSSDWVVFTRDINPNDPNLSTNGLTKDSLSSAMKSSNSYLNSWDRDHNLEITITMVESPVKDYNLLSDTTLSTLATAFKSEYESLGITYLESEIYQHAQAKFIKIYTSEPDGDSTVYGLQYITAYADKAIFITMHSYSGQITAEKESTLKSAVDSVKFGTEPPSKETKLVSADAFEYTDSQTQTSFTVPANWSEEALSEDSESIQAIFVSNEEEGLCILYGSADVWGEMPEKEQNEYPRSGVNNSAFTKSDVAEMRGISTSQIETATYGGYEYYKTEVPASDNLYGANFSITMTQMFRVENGYMYWFYFGGTSDSKYYTDFEALLESVKYSQSSGSISAINQNSSIEDGDDFSIGTLLLSLMITIVIYSLPIIIYRYVIRKASVDPQTAKRITIIYGVVAFLVMSLLIFALSGSRPASVAILLWSYVNYRVLVGGKSVQTAVKDAAQLDHNAEDDATEMEQKQNDTLETSENDDGENSES